MLYVCDRSCARSSAICLSLAEQTFCVHRQKEDNSHRWLHTRNLYKCQRWLWLACDLILCTGVKLFLCYIRQVLTILFFFFFLVAAEWTNCNLYFQTLLTVLGALMETTPMAIHSTEPYHAGLLDSPVLGSSLPQGVQRKQSSQNSKTGYLCKMSIPMGGFHNSFFVLTR